MREGVIYVPSQGRECWGVHRSGRIDKAQGELIIAKNSEKCIALDVKEVNHNKRKGVNQEESESKYILEG
jgi:hypothetical protein